MPRFSSKLFKDLAIWMLGFGLIIGAIFPFFVSLLGIPTSYLMTPGFFSATIVAGLIAGVINFGLATLVVKPRLRILADKMNIVETSLVTATYTGDWSQCNPLRCSVPVDSEDEIGKSAAAFNKLLVSLFKSHQIEEAVSNFTKGLSSQLELDSLGNLALEMLIEHTESLAGCLLIVDRGETKILSQHGLTNTAALENNEVVQRVLNGVVIERISIPSGVNINAVLTEFSPKETIVVPVRFKHIPVGAIVLAANKPYTPNIERLLLLFADGLGLALNNALAHDSLQKLAALDVLTGAYNRRFGMKRLNEEFNRSLRTRNPLGMIMYDLDHFKKVNDTYGHIAGDKVLNATCCALINAMRQGDILIRFGGEEFILLLPGASKKDTKLLAERFRHLIAETVVLDSSNHIKVTASIGATSFPEFNVENENEMIKIVDEALYSSKGRGRNNVVML